MNAATATSPPHADVALQVLMMPMPHSSFAEYGDMPHAHAGSSGPSTAPSRSARAFYRWILGHQGAVCVWRLLAEALREAITGTNAAGEYATALYNAYSALLLYAGSCTRETYHSVIRARMRARNPAFSGTWAREYEMVRRRLDQLKPASGSPLMRAVRFNQLVHITIARRLVPDGGSLHRDAGRDPHRMPTDVERDLFDEFFMVGRNAPCRHEFAAQLHRRIELILADVAACPVDIQYERGEVDAFQAGLAANLDLSATADELLSLTETTKRCA